MPPDRTRSARSKHQVGGWRRERRGIGKKKRDETKRTVTRAKEKKKQVEWNIPPPGLDRRTPWKTWLVTDVAIASVWREWTERIGWDGGRTNEEEGEPWTDTTSKHTHGREPRRRRAQGSIPEEESQWTQMCPNRSLSARGTLVADERNGANADGERKTESKRIVELTQWIQTQTRSSPLLDMDT